MIRSFLSAALLCMLVTACAQNKKGEYVVTIKTNYGDMTAILYDETPKHKENFLKLIHEKFYDSLLFHRVVPAFMIQGGDPDSKKAAAGQRLGSGGPGYTVEAEFRPGLFHERGALAAARTGGPANPTKASSGSQFYIVQGKVLTAEELDQQEQNIRNSRKSELLREIIMTPKYQPLLTEIQEHQRAQDGAWMNAFFENSDTLIVKEKPGYKPFAFSSEQKTAYTTTGGAPFLDGDYTVFGKVIKGLEVIDKIAAITTQQERPIEDVRMFITVKQLSRKAIEKEY
ncbi:MAG TPA: peptidylprolyl isomerase, partial [Cyclobacteriaceae bacterium]|nr:peptidylprolyl isomerase [Cyclobacteriaceae bacterium]